MRILKRIIIALLILIAVITVGVWIFTHSLKPTYDGTLKLDGLSDKVEVLYDDYGVPHIYAENEMDAQRALGYVHAQDRLWQMEVMSRIAAGRLSEILGDETLEIDKFFLGLGIDEYVDKTVETVDKTTKSYQMMTAYLDGINAFVKNGPTPLEYYLVGAEKTSFTFKDVLNVLGYMSFSFAQGHKTDPLVYHFQETLGVDYIKELGIEMGENYEKIPIHYRTELGSILSEGVGHIMDKLPVPAFIGSNAWVVGPEKTKYGKVILANDPHIGYGQPSVWYQAYIKTPELELYGNYIALMPFPLLGHNHRFAYGITMFENDDIDFYMEKVDSSNPNQYLSPTGTKSFKTRTKTIKVKGGDDVVLNLRSSEHGPIMNGIIDGMDITDPIAMDWIYTKIEDDNLDAFYKVSRSENMDQFEHGLSQIHAPGLNVMYGDAEDNIAWWAVGKLYQHADGVPTKTVLDGSNGIDDQLSYLDFSVNPQSINPPQHYVYSANNQPDTIAGRLYPGYYLPTDRAKRIVDVLDDKTGIKAEDMELMIHDVTSSTAPDIIKLALENIDNDVHPAFAETKAILGKWKGNYGMDEIAPTIYIKFLYQYMKHTYADEMGADKFTSFLNAHLGNRQVSEQIFKKESIWWDNTATKTIVESRADVLSQAMAVTLQELESQLGSDMSTWQWKKVFSIEHEHPIGKKVSALRATFNVGPFQINGGHELINNQIFDLNGTGIYQAKAGPSSRRVIDFSNVENSMGIIPTGQSGNVFSKHYRDLAPLFHSEQLTKMYIKRGEVEDLDGDVLIFN